MGRMRVGKMVGFVVVVAVGDGDVFLQRLIVIRRAAGARVRALTHY